MAKRTQEPQRGDGSATLDYPQQQQQQQGVSANTPASCNTSYANLSAEDDHHAAQPLHVTRAEPIDDLYGDYQGVLGISVASSSVVLAQCSNDDGIQPKHAVVRLFSARHIGLLVSLAFASVLTSCIKRGLLPLLKSELKLSATQFDAAQILLTLPWACTFFLGFCSDAFPIFGCYRKPYMVLGWCVTSLALFVLAFVNYTQEYDMRIKNEDASLGAQDRVRILNVYVGLLVLASFGGILSVIVAEIYVIQQSRTTSLRHRGHMVGTFLMTQFAFEMVGQLVTDLVIFRVTKFGLFPLYSFRSVVLFFVFYALAPIPALLWFFDEWVADVDLRQLPTRDLEIEKLQRTKQRTVDDFDDESDENDGPGDAVAVLGDQARSGAGYARNGSSALKAHTMAVLALLKRQSTLRVVRFLALFTFFTEFTLTYPHAMLDTWSGMTLKLESSGKILAEAMYVIAIFTWKLLCFEMDWRMLASGTLVLFFMLPQCVYFFLVVYGVGRSAQAYTIIKALRGLLRAVIVLLEVLIAVEITPRGSEGATLGVVVSAGTVMRLLAATSSNLLGQLLGSKALDDQSASKPTIKLGASGSGSDAAASAVVLDHDGSAIRNHAASMLAVCFCIRILALFGLKYLPRQRQALQQELHKETAESGGTSRTGSSSRGNAIGILAMLLGSLAIVAVVNTLVVMPASSRAACGSLSSSGTSGCKDSADLS